METPLGAQSASVLQTGTGREEERETDRLVTRLQADNVTFLQTNVTVKLSEN